MTTSNPDIFNPLGQTMENFNVKLEWVLIPLFCSLTGYTSKAVQRKIEEGKWLEGRMYRRAPDGHLTMNLQEYYRWVTGASSPN